MFGAVRAVSCKALKKKKEKKYMKSQAQGG